MRTFLFLLLCVGVLAAAGIIHFRKHGDRVDVSIDTGELREKTEDLIDAVKDTLSDDNDADSINERFNDFVEGAREAIDATEDSGSGLLDHGRGTNHRFPR
jgi:hypothetical protein